MRIIYLVTTLESGSRAIHGDRLGVQKLATGFGSRSGGCAGDDKNRKGPGEHGGWEEGGVVVMGAFKR